MRFLLVAALAFLSDFAVKRHVDGHCELGEKKPLGCCPKGERCKGGGSHGAGRNLFFVEKYYNEGAVFNLLKGKPDFLRKIQHVAVSVAGFVYGGLLCQKGKTARKIGASLVVGGGLSNLYDREEKGHVVDYIRPNFGPKFLRRIVFNLSDVFIFVGMILVVLGGRDDGKEKRCESVKQNGNKRERSTKGADTE